MSRLPEKRPLPAYLEYASDILASLNYRLMSLEERGLWDTMRKECWVNDRLPSNPHELAKILNIESATLQHALTKRVKSFFIEEDGSFISPELEGYRDGVLQRRELMSKGGAKGGKATQHSNREAKASLEASLEGRLKGLNRDEMQRHEMRGKELPRSKKSIEAHKEWLEEFGNDDEKK
jgi:hypothetical protein